MFTRRCPLVAAILVASTTAAQVAPPFDAAAAFGTREDVSEMSLSPDGKSVAYVAATAGPGSAAVVLDLAEGGKPHVVFATDGKPSRLHDCRWVSNERLVCVVYGVVSNGIDLLPFTRVVAIDRSGANSKVLSTQQPSYSRGFQMYGGWIVDWLPDQEGFVLMSRGSGVDLLDTRNLSVKNVEEPYKYNATFLSDGRGTIRIVGRRLKPRPDAQDTGIVTYQYRKQSSREWLALGEFDEVKGSGFNPLAVDHDLNLAYGLKKKDGRWAIYSVALDGSLAENLIYARPDVDVTRLIRVGRRNRVVGVAYSVEMFEAVYFDPTIETLMKSLSRALPTQPNLRLVDSSVDEQVLLVFAGSDDDPGLYYVFDRAAKKLQRFVLTRSELAGVKLAKVRPISYEARDGVMIPGYLTLPPGEEDSKALPAIVLPHGGPSARDYWGFNWLSQFFAARGFAVLQPNFRGSAGYGDAWFGHNGFKAWRIAIGDVLDAGHWLVAQGVADPAKLSVVGWSYGGYAALQSAVTEPGLFKAVVAIAPITDLQALKEERRGWSNFDLISEEVGEGPHVREGSPARNAERIKAPVLLFHGAFDRNVGIRQSRIMAEHLTKAGVKNELVTWDHLDQYLEDSEARTQMLRKADEFLRQAYGSAP